MKIESLIPRQRVRPVFENGKAILDANGQPVTAKQDCIRIVTAEGVELWPSVKQFEDVTKIQGKRALTDYIGGKALVTYMKKGETLLNGSIVRDDNVIVKSFDGFIPRMEVLNIETAAHSGMTTYAEASGRM